MSLARHLLTQLEENVMRILVLSLAALTCGCYSVGNRQIADDNIIAQIEEGKTTKPEVSKLIGTPSEVDFDEQTREKWTYRYTIAKVSGRSFIPIVGSLAGPDTESHTLTILFDDNDTVLKVGKGWVQSRDTLQHAAGVDRPGQTQFGSYDKEDDDF